MRAGIRSACARRLVARPGGSPFQVLVFHPSERQVGGDRFCANRAVALLSLAFARWTLVNGRDPEEAERALSAAGASVAALVRSR